MDEKIGRRIPISPFIFLIALADFLVMIPEASGQYLTLFLVPFWSILSVNLGFLSVFYDVKSKRLPLWFLALPIIYFAGYLALTTASHQEAAQTAKLVAEQNEKVKIPFYPDSASLVFTNSSIAQDVLNSYDVPVVYNTVGIEIKSDKYQSRRIEKIPPNVSFQKGNWNTYDKASRVSYMPIYESDSPQHIAVEGYCIAEAPESPKRPAYQISDITMRETKDWFLSKDFQAIQIQGPDGKKYELKTVTLHPLCWLPVPVLGYYGTWSGEKWHNISRFQQEIEAGPDLEKLLAGALGLREASYVQRCKEK